MENRLHEHARLCEHANSYKHANACKHITTKYACTGYWHTGIPVLMPDELIQKQSWARILLELLQLLPCNLNLLLSFAFLLHTDPVKTWTCLHSAFLLLTSASSQPWLDPADCWFISSSSWPQLVPVDSCVWPWLDPDYGPPLLNLFYPTWYPACFLSSRLQTATCSVYFLHCGWCTSVSTVQLERRSRGTWFFYGFLA